MSETNRNPDNSLSERVKINPTDKYPFLTAEEAACFDKVYKGKGRGHTMGRADLLPMIPKHFNKKAFLDKLVKFGYLKKSTFLQTGAQLVRFEIDLPDFKKSE